MKKLITLFIFASILVGLNACSPVKPPVACIEFADSDLVGFKDIQVKLNSGCSENIGSLEWTTKNDTFLGAYFNVAPLIKNNSTLTDTINLTVYGINKEEKSTSTFLLTAARKKRKIPAFMCGITYYDNYNNTSCPFYNKVTLIKGNTGSPYEYYIQNVQNPAIKLGITITGTNSGYNYSSGTDFEIYFDIPQQNVSGNYIFGSGYVVFQLNSKNELVGKRYLNITIDSQSACDQYIGTEI